MTLKFNNIFYFCFDRLSFTSFVGTAQLFCNSISTVNYVKYYFKYSIKIQKLISCA